MIFLCVCVVATKKADSFEPAFPYLLYIISIVQSLYVHPTGRIHTTNNREPVIILVLLIIILIIQNSCVIYLRRCHFVVYL